MYTRTYPLDTVCHRVKELSTARRQFFLCWLETHTRLRGLNQEGDIKEELKTWIHSLPIDRAIMGHDLIMDEIEWCTNVSPYTLERLVAVENL